MMKVTFSIKFEAQNHPFGPGEGSQERIYLCVGYGFEAVARFYTFDIMGFGYIGTRKYNFGLWSRFEETTKTNDSVTKL
jgi:hypothetical protein